MANLNSSCKHRWIKDDQELVCVYCGTMLYREQGPTGPIWRPRILGDKEQVRNGRTGNPLKRQGKKDVKNAQL